MKLKKTPLYDIHLRAGAKFTDFSGYEMPIEYGSVIAEHTAVRSGAGIFDVSHMGEIELRGRSAFAALQRLTTNDTSRLRLGRAQYTLICNKEGGVVDDVIVYCIAPDHFLICVNASNTTKVFEWIKAQNFSGATATDLSDATALLALQGPASVKILDKVADFDTVRLKPFGFMKGTVAGIHTIVARTGYTGEDGFEFFVGNEDAPKLWESLMEAGEPYGVIPIGLAARDTLRIEMGYPLYGHELNDETSPLDAGLKRFVCLNKEDFIGRAAILEKEKDKNSKKLVGFTLTSPGIARSGHKILTRAGEVAGEVTSGSHSPTLKRSIGMGFVDPGMTEPGTEIAIEIRNKPVGAVVTRPPFYKRDKKTATD